MLTKQASTARIASHIYIIYIYIKEMEHNKNGTSYFARIYGKSQRPVKHLNAK